MYVRLGIIPLLINFALYTIKAEQKTDKFLNCLKVFFFSIFYFLFCCFWFILILICPYIFFFNFSLIMNRNVGTDKKKTNNKNGQKTIKLNKRKEM